MFQGRALLAKIYKAGCNGEIKISAKILPCGVLTGKA
jgi:hypothetical protein